MPAPGLTRPQLALFWRAFSAAATAQGAADREAYRRAVLREEGGVEHLAQLSRTRGFDRVILRLAVDAGDYALASRFSSGDERRMAALCADCATQLLQLAAMEPSGGAAAGGEQTAIAYIGGILRQARLAPPFPCADGPDWWLDVSGGCADSVFRILDTHRRRLLRRLAPSAPMAYRHGRRWHRDGAGALAHADSAAPVAVRFRVVA